MPDSETPRAARWLPECIERGERGTLRDSNWRALGGAACLLLTKVEFEQVGIRAERAKVQTDETPGTEGDVFGVPRRRNLPQTRLEVNVITRIIPILQLKGRPCSRVYDRCRQQTPWPKHLKGRCNVF